MWALFHKSDGTPNPEETWEFEPSPDMLAILHGTEAIALEIPEGRTPEDCTASDQDPPNGAWAALPDLTALKVHRSDHVTKKTQVLIDAGFSWAGLDFSLDDSHRGDWIGIRVFRSVVPYPLAVLSLDGHSVSELADETELLAFAEAAFFRYATITGGGAALKGAIETAPDVATLDGIIDSRT